MVVKRSAVRSAVLLVVDIITTGCFAIAAMIAARFLPDGENSAHRVAQRWGKTILRLSGVTVEVIGKDNIPDNRSVIFMANHQSNFDILSLLAHIPVQFRWISKKEVFRTPLMGPAMKRAGYLSIDRGNREKAIESLEQAARVIRNGRSVMTFPEGTRSPDGRIKPFKKGLFYLAIKSGVPIVPLSIIGSRAIMTKKSLHIDPGKITIVIGTPVDTSNVTIAQRDDLMATVQSVIEENFYNTPSVEGGKTSP
jgi:1-acyl-sn-glycerol-3-phosphate acyltransferase